MNVRFVINQLGVLLMIMSGVLLGLALLFIGLATLEGAEFDVYARMAMIGTGIAGLVIGGSMVYGTRRTPSKLGRRDALLLVSLSWLLGAVYAAVPYFAWAHVSEFASPDHPFRNFVDCYFEAMSGLTTTGATVLGDAPNSIEALPRTLLLWRAFTQWIGGLGIVVLFVAVLPSLGVGGKRLYRVEAPGPTKDVVTPNVRETARMLWYIYLGLSVAEFAMLMIAGLNWFDAVCHTFTTVATGGFSTNSSSIGEYPSYVKIIILMFMVLAGINFALFYEALRGRWRVLFKDTELRVYLAMLLIATAVITVSIYGIPNFLSSGGRSIDPHAGNALLEAAFATTALQTTTGYVSSDYDRWPFIAQAALIAVMFFGGCSGSTAGGIKVVRIWVMFKILITEVERIFRPNVVRPVRLGHITIDETMKKATLAFVLSVIVLWILGAIGVMVLEQGFNAEVECTFTTAATASLASINIIGPAFDQAGPTESFVWMSTPTKALLSLLMVIGRLELFAILVLFSPRFWTGE